MTLHTNETKSAHDDVTTPQPFHVGLLHFTSEPGREVEERLNSLPPFYTQNGTFVKVQAEHVKIHEISLDYHTKYQVIIDRSSHRVLQAVGILKLFAFRGVTIINNPLSFWWFIDSKDAGYGMMKDLGILVPRTYLLPQHTTPYLNEHEFIYHRQFNWEAMMQEIEWPCYIKPTDGRGAISCNKAHNMKELLDYYNQSGEKVMMVQQNVASPYDWHVRCLCIGRKIIPMKYIFRKDDLAEYIYEKNFLVPEVEQEIIHQARVINRAFGYEMNSVEFVIDSSQRAWAIDFNNPVPDGRREKLGKHYFNQYVQALVTVAIDKVYYTEEGPFLPPLNEYAEIARQPLPVPERYQRALSLANLYYERPDPPLLTEAEEKKDTPV
jgi:hypothetical protein